LEVDGKTIVNSIARKAVGYVIQETIELKQAVDEYRKQKAEASKPPEEKRIGFKF